jgi:hypothetical protein
LRDIIFPPRPATARFNPELEAQREIDNLVAASKAGTLGDKMVRTQSEYPKVAIFKILVTDNAIEHSNPNATLLKKPAEWLYAFHSTREWLVRLTFDLLRLGVTQTLADKLEIMKSQVNPRYIETLFTAVVQAVKDVQEKSHHALEPEYRRAGKLDILEKAIELYDAEMAAQDGKPLFQSDVHIQETDIIITDETVTEESADDFVMLSIDTADPTVIDSESPGTPTEAPVLSPVLSPEPTGTVSGDLDVNDREVPDLSPASTVSDNVDVHDREVLDDSDVTTDTEPTSEDMAGIAKLFFFPNGDTCDHEPMVLSIPSGLDVNVHMAPNQSLKYLQNSDIFLEAFDGMVKILKSRIDAAKAADAAAAVLDFDWNFSDSDESL